jgi:Domain of unknown function (DUF4290)
MACTEATRIEWRFGNRTFLRDNIKKNDMQVMNLDYNTQQPHLVIPEYGRNIQRMIE